MPVLTREPLTGEYYEPGTVPAEQSQGAFVFGLKCAKNALRLVAQPPNRTIER